MRFWEVLAGLLLMALATTMNGNAAVWQYRATTPDGKGHAVLWIPPHCTHVRGILIGRQVILENNVFEDPVIRKAAADENLAILLDDSALGYFDYGSKGSNQEVDLEAYLQSFADQSGYPEIVDAPFVSLGHSGGGIFAWHLGYWNPGRMIGIVGLHTVPIFHPDFDDDATVSGVPSLDISGEFESWGNPARPLNHHWRWARGICLSMRSVPGDGLITEIVERGAGHFSWTPQLANYVAMFIRKACDARIPVNPPAGVPVVCNHVQIESGWLTDADIGDKRRYESAPYSQYKGDPTLAFWGFDKEQANATESFNDQLTDGKLRQMIGFVQSGKPLKPEWLVPLTFEPIGDGTTIKVAASYIDHVPDGVGDAGDPVYPSYAPIKYDLIGGWRGGGEQTGPDTFRIKFNHFGLDRAGSLMIRAYSEGDATHSYTEMAGSVTFPVRNASGTPQTITFPPIADQPADVASIPLAATSDSGLPVEYFVQYGPAYVEGNTLKIAEIPVGAKLPIKVSVVAYQWGRIGASAIMSAMPVERTFLVRGLIRTEPRDSGLAVTLVGST